MLSLGEEEDLKRYSFLAWLQTLLLSILVAGSAWVLGGARTWILLPIFWVTSLLIVLQILRVILTRDSVLFRFDSADFLVVVFILYAGARYLTSPTEYSSRLELLMIISAATVFWVVRYSLTHSVQGLFLLYVLVLNGLGLSVFAIWVHFHPEIHPYDLNLTRYYYPRLIGTFGCPNHLGDYLLIALSAALALALYVRGRWPLRILLFYAAFFMTCVLGCTLSRGAWLGLVAGGVALTIFCMRHSSLRWFVPLGVYGFGVFAAILLIFHYPSLTHRVDEIVEHVQNNTLDHYVRVQLASDALKIWHDHFWFGTGPATFNFVHPRYQTGFYGFRAYYAHNEYVNTLADYGLTGGLLVGGFMLVVTILLLRRLDHRAPSSRRIVLCAALTVWVSVLVHCLVDYNLHIPACAMAFFMVVGLGLRRSSNPGLHLPSGQCEVVHGLFACLLVAVLVAFLGLTWRTTAGYYPYWEAVDYSKENEPNNSQVFRPADEAIPLLKKSIQADPANPLSSALLGEFYRLQAYNSTDPFNLASEALYYHQMALKANPLDDEVFVKVGFDYDLLKRFSEAYWCYQTLVERVPYNGYYRQALGANLRQQGKIEEAIQAYQQAKDCPVGSEGCVEEIQHLQALLPEPNDPYNHSPTVP